MHTCCIDEPCEDIKNPKFCLTFVGKWEDLWK
jgi:hypothetical protein